MSKLPHDATVATIIHSLRDPDKYLSRLQHNMILFQREHGCVALVRIGVTGGGIAPHYRIQPDKPLWDALEDSIFGGKKDDLTRYYKAYNGTSHEHFAGWGAKELSDHNWSAETTDIEEIQRLLGKLRGKAGH